jgi:hypothetical protein
MGSVTGAGKDVAVEPDVATLQSVERENRTGKGGLAAAGFADQADILAMEISKLDMIDGAERRRV